MDYDKLDEVYKNYTNYPLATRHDYRTNILYQKGWCVRIGRSIVAPHPTRYLTKEEFIYRCKVDFEFSAKWGLKIERILCAAIWYKEISLKKEIPQILPKNCDKGIVVTGLRHCHCIWTVSCLTGLRSVTYADDGVGEYIEGFLTSNNRFVERKEALIIALRENQVLSEIRGDELYSENLY